MKLDELRARQRQRLLAHPVHFELPPTMTQELWGMLERVALPPLGTKPLKGSRDHRLLGCLEKLALVILSANGYYMIRDNGRQALADRHPK